MTVFHKMNIKQMNKKFTINAGVQVRDLHLRNGVTI